MSSHGASDKALNSGAAGEGTSTNEGGAAADRVIVTMVMTGYTQVSGKKPGIIVCIVNGDGTLGPESYYSAQGFKGVSVGHIFKVEALKDDPSGRIYVNTIQWIGTWPNPEQRLEWDAAARVYQTRKAAAREAGKESRRNLIRQALGPLRAIYNSTNWQNRVALEVLVLTYLRQGEAGLDSIQHSD